MSTYILPGTLAKGDGTQPVATATTTAIYLDLPSYLSRETQNTSVVDITAGSKWYFRTGLQVTGWKLRIPSAFTVTVKLWEDGVEVRSETVAYGAGGNFSGTFSGGAFTCSGTKQYALTMRNGTNNLYYFRPTDTSDTPYPIHGGGLGRQMMGPGITYLGNSYFTPGSGFPNAQDAATVFYPIIPTFSVVLAP